MSIATYAELKTALATRSRRSDLTASMGDFVGAAHDRIVGRMAMTAAVAFSSAAPSLPSDFRVVDGLLLDAAPAVFLQPVAPAQVVNFGSGLPRCYSVAAAVMTVYPTPDQAYTGRLLYKVSRTAFTADADTNTVLQRYPRLYLYGALAELFADVRNAVERDRYLALFTAGLEEASATELEDFYGDAILQAQIPSGAP